MVLFLCVLFDLWKQTLKIHTTVHFSAARTKIRKNPVEACEIGNPHGSEKLVALATTRVEIRQKATQRMAVCSVLFVKVNQ